MSILLKAKSLKPTANASGQVMILATLALGGVVLGVTTIAGILITYEIRRATDFQNSARAVFAADAGVECALYDYFKGSTGNTCASSLTLSNGASYVYATSNVSPPAPVGWWTFDEGGLSVVHDSSGNGNDGTWYGSGAHWSDSAKVGSYAGEFNGRDDYVLSTDLGSPPQSVSLAAWVNPNSAGGVVFSELGQGIINSGVHDAQMEVDVGGVAKVCVLTGGETCVAAGSVNFGQWSHVVMVYDASARTLTGYVNGVAGNVANNVAKQNSGNLYYAVGAADTMNGGNGAYYSGLVDDARIYAAALSPQDVLNLYNGVAPAITIMSEGKSGTAARAFIYSL